MFAPLTRDAPARGIFGDDEVRVDGDVKVSGRAVYTADIRKPGMLWAAFATSPVAHGHIRSIDTEAARAVPGVRAILTGADIGPRFFGRQLRDWPVLAYDRVRFTGERVAAVAAETPAAAEEAARLIDVTYDELPGIFEGSEALADGAPVLHANGDEYAYFGEGRRTRRHPNVQGEAIHVKGEADLAPIFASAYRVFEHRFTTPRQHHGFIEPHATLVWIDGDGVLRVHSPNKSPFRLRQQLAATLELPPERIVIEPSLIGGDFGGKGLTIDEFPCYYLARATGRPVKSVMRYVDELQGTNTRHRSEIRMKTAIGRDGKLLAHEAEVIYNGGAYAAAKANPLLLPGGPGFGSIGYQVPNVRLEIFSMYTNTVPAGNMRSPTDVQTLFAFEVHLDMIARELGADPLEFRIRNAVRDGDRAVTGAKPRLPRAVEVLEVLKRDPRANEALAPGRGRGFALDCRETGQGKTGLSLSLFADGTLQARTGVPDQGGGSSTVIQRVIAAELSTNLERIRVARANTADAHSDPGAGSSRVTHIVGGAAQVAARKMRDLLETKVGGPLNPSSFDRAVAIACADGPVNISAEYDSSVDDVNGHDYSFCAYAIEVAVDAETGAVCVVDALAAIDVGTIINPVAHQGQVDGGFVYGWGSALLEELSYQDGKIATLSLADYKLPTIRDVPPLRTVHVQGAPGSGPFGAKMIGELMNSGVAPAVVNAIFDAVGIRLTTFPVTPERVYDELEVQRTQSGAGR